MYNSSDEDGSRKENVPDNALPDDNSSESPDQLEVGIDDDTQDQNMVEEDMDVGQVEDPDVNQEEEKNEDEPANSQEETSPKREISEARTRDTTSIESMADADDEDDGDEEEEEEKGGGENSANVSFTPLLQNVDNLIHIGIQHQAEIAVGSPEPAEKEKDPDRDQAVWDCKIELDSEKLDKYVDEACGRFMLSIDRVLYILGKCKYDFEIALEECSKRKEIAEIWTKEEANLFSTCFFNFGKKFTKIKAAMPQRTLSSIIQYYYGTKKFQNYKSNIGYSLNEDDKYDELIDDINHMERIESGSCENCNEKSDILVLNKMLSRYECRPCILYFRLMRTPRPTNLLAMVFRSKNRAICPEYMRTYVNGYFDLMSPADGKACERLGIGEVKESEDEDDDCMIVDESEIRRPSDPYIPKNEDPDGDDVDSNTCRMTRRFDSPEAKKIIDNVRKKHHIMVPLVWRKKQTKCMEDIKLINEESRKEMYKTSITNTRINIQDMNGWKRDMAQLKHRFGRMSPDTDTFPVTSGTSRSGRVRYDFNWTDDEKRDAVRCFHWYYTDFDTISEVLATKTSEQVKSFYLEHEETIDKSVKAYREALRTRMGESGF